MRRVLDRLKRAWAWIIAGIVATTFVVLAVWDWFRPSERGAESLDGVEARREIDELRGRRKEVTRQREQLDARARASDTELRRQRDNVQETLTTQGDLDDAALEAALREALGEH